MSTSKKNLTVWQELIFSTSMPSEFCLRLRQNYIQDLRPCLKDHRDEDDHDCDHDCDNDNDDDDAQVGRRLVELVDDANSSGFTCFNQPVFIIFFTFNHFKCIQSN